MSDTSSLTELARFIGQSGLAGGAAERRAVNDLDGRLKRAPAARPRVSDLLSVVLTLSARTRRVVMPRVEIDLDVFAPGGQRAVRILLPE
ncbi:MAG TPA: hypothetical protein VHZ56_09405 [Devosia sp.]|jgi:hypothetical protein|nr:hypothetical protein [Devosia sp.]